MAKMARLEKTLLAAALCAVSSVACAGSNAGTDAEGSDGAAGRDASGSGGSESGGGSGGDAASVELKLEVSPDRDRSPISPFIYGAMDEEAITALDATLARLSGNEMTAYNWEMNASNLGRHGEHMNVPLGPLEDPGSAPRVMLDLAERYAGMAYLTIPLGDYVAADADETNVLDTANTLAERFRQNLAVKGSAFDYPPDATDDFVYQDEFVSWVMSMAGQTPVVFGLGNQPSLWDQDHPVVNLVKTRYADVVDLNVEFAQALKDVWPEAMVAGPVLYGWQAFVNLQNSPDFDTHGEFLDYYLAAMQAAEDADGRRLLDVLDVRWWTASKVGGIRINSDDVGPEVVAARVQAPRSLWDEQYVEPSWITNSIGDHAIGLIPRLKQKIAEHYPGTELGISAWMFGGGKDISGAIAAADALGIFGREAIAFAAVELALDSPYVVAAYRTFLNYDGDGGRFLDTSVRATSSDHLGSSVYASSDSADDSNLVIVAINKRPLVREVTLTIDSDREYPTSDVYELTEESNSLVPAPPLTADDGGAFSYDMPSMSVVVFVPQE